MSNTNSALQPWKAIPKTQFKFIQDVMTSHEYADIVAKLDLQKLQDRIDWMWNLHQQGAMSYDQAINGVYDLAGASQSTISIAINSRIDAGGDDFHIEKGTECFYIENGKYHSVIVTHIVVCFGSSNGGAYPIHVVFKKGDVQMTEYFDCYGLSLSGGQLVESRPSSNKLSDEDLESAHQLFIENLYSNFRWTEFAHREPHAGARICFAKKLWTDFQTQFDLKDYPLTQEAYSSLVITFAENNLQDYE